MSGGVIRKMAAQISIGVVGNRPSFVINRRPRPRADDLRTIPLGRIQALGHEKAGPTVGLGLQTGAVGNLQHIAYAIEADNGLAIESITHPAGLLLFRTPGPRAGMILGRALVQPRRHLSGSVGGDSGISLQPQGKTVVHGRLRLGGSQTGH